MNRTSGLLLVAAGAGLGAFFAHDPAPLLRTATAVAGTLLVVVGVMIYMSPLRAASHSGDPDAR